MSAEPNNSEKDGSGKASLDEQQKKLIETLVAMETNATSQPNNREVVPQKQSKPVEQPLMIVNKAQVTSLAPIPNSPNSADTSTAQLDDMTKIVASLPTSVLNEYMKPKKPVMYYPSYISRRGRIYEAIIFKGEPRFLYFDEEKGAQICGSIETEQFIIKPKVHSVVTDTPWTKTDYVFDVLPIGLPNITDLFQRTFDCYDTFLYLDRVSKIILTAMSILSYIQEKFQTLPYAHLLGDSGTGKSSAEIIFQQLSYRAIKTVHTTSANIYTKYEQFQPGNNPGVWILDEFKVRFDESILTILKAGYEKGNSVLRIETTKEGRVQKEYQTFGIKLIAGVESFSDEAMRRRTLEIHTYEGIPSKSIKTELQKNPKLFNKLSNDLLIWRMRLGLKKVFDKVLDETLDKIPPEIREHWGPLLDVSFKTPFFKELLGIIEKQIIEKYEGLYYSTDGYIARALKMVVLDKGELMNVPFEAILLELINSGFKEKEERNKKSLETPDGQTVSKIYIVKRIKDFFGGKRGVIGGQVKFDFRNREHLEHSIHRYVAYREIIEKAKTDSNNKPALATNSTNTPI